MEEDPFELLRQLKEKALDEEAMHQERAPDVTKLRGLLDSLPEGSLERPRLQLVAETIDLSLNTRTKVHDHQVLIVQMLEQIWSLHRRIMALEERLPDDE